jgi:hypothetical protein
MVTQLAVEEVAAKFPHSHIRLPEGLKVTEKREVKERISIE